MNNGGQARGSVGGMKLYSGPLSMFGAKAEIAALEKGLEFELVMVPFEMATLYQPKHPEVLRINPKRQVPVLVDGDLEIFEFDADLRVSRDLEARAGAVAGRAARREPARGCSSTSRTRSTSRRSSG